MIPDEAPAGGVNFSDIAVMVQGGYGAVFGIMLQFFDLYECRGTS